MYLPYLVILSTIGKHCEFFGHYFVIITRETTFREYRRD